MFPFSDTLRSGKLPIMTITIIAINVLVFIEELVVPNPDQFLAKYTLIPALFSISDMSTWYRIITAAFLHGGFAHIFFNMLFLWVFGDNVEAALGSFWYLLFYLAAAVISGLTQYAIDPTSTIPMLGASGAIAGVLGFYMIAFPQHNIRTLMLFGFRIFTTVFPAQLFLGYWIITQIISGATTIATSSIDVSGTAWFAHIGGFAFGALIGFLMRNRQVEPYYA